MKISKDCFFFFEAKHQELTFIHLVISDFIKIKTRNCFRTLEVLSNYYWRFIFSVERVYSI